MKIYYKYTSIRGIDRVRLYYADFICDFSWDRYHNHTFKGSIKRHILIEEFLFRINDWMMDYDSCGWYNILNFFIEMFLGLNCNFPIKKVFQYLVFEYFIRPRYKVIKDAD